MTGCHHPGKKRYTSKKAARRGMVELYKNRAAGGGRLHVYQCGDHWHVGHLTRESWRDGHR